MKVSNALICDRCQRIIRVEQPYQLNGKDLCKDCFNAYDTWYNNPKAKVFVTTG